VNEPAPPRVMARAAGRGLAAAAATAVFAEAISITGYLATGRPFGLWSFVKIGWLYLLAFHRVGLGVSLGGPLVSGVASGAPTAVAGTYVYTIHAAFLVGTLLAGWLLFRAGRADGSEPSRGWPAVATVLGYAAPIALGSSAAIVRFPGFGIASVRPVAWEAAAFPFLFAAVAVGVGVGLTASRSPRAVLARAVAGGWRMLWWSLSLAFIGFLVVAGARPDASGAYAGFIRREGGLGALVAVHHALAAPNQSVAMLAVAMGSCDGLYGPGGGWDLACQGRLVDPTALANFGELARQAPSLGTIGVHVGEAPWWWWLFAIAPAAATIAGGRRAARGSHGVAAAVGAGVLFAVFVGVASWAASISVGIPAAASSSAATVRLGPSLPRTALLAIAWGVIGGVLGALTAGGGAQDQRLGEEPPPSPTSE